MAQVKFSEFTDGNNVQVGDTVVGLRSGVNYKFSYPGDGIEDSNGNYLYKYVSVGAAAVNYLETSNSATGNSPFLTVDGDDANIDLTLTPKGTGNIVIDSLTWPTGDGTPGQSLVTDGAGQLSFATESGTGDVLAQVFLYMGA